MNRLLLDLGNTRLKWALYSSQGEWLTRGALRWDELDGARMRTLWQDLPKTILVRGASVVDARREQLVADSLQQLGLPPPHWMSTPTAACGVRNAYAEPKRLGIDRFLAMIAVHVEGRTPCVLVGVGTALTLDALNADGQHLGGLITPGPRLMRESLLGATTRLHPATLGRIVDAAANTDDAIESGCWQSAAALIERFTTRMTLILGTQTRLYLSGGDAAALSPLLSPPHTVRDDSVLQGLAYWLKRSGEA